MLLINRTISQFFCKSNHICGLLDKTETKYVVFMLVQGTENEYHKVQAKFVILVLGTKSQHKNYILYPSHNIFICLLLEIIQISEI